MRFIIQLWPDIDGGTATADPRELVQWAVTSVRESGELLSWSIEDDGGNLIADDVVITKEEAS